MSHDYNDFKQIMDANKDWKFDNAKDFPEETDGRPMWPDQDELPEEEDMTKESRIDLSDPIISKNEESQSQKCWRKFAPHELQARAL